MEFKHRSAADYPCPQLRRDSWLNLNGAWKFCFDDAGEYFAPSAAMAWTHSINVPFCPESKASGIEDNGFHKNLWYEKEFEVPAWDGRFVLHFGAIDYQACVWVNGQFLCAHEGGHTPFEVDITKALNPTGKQILTVWAKDDPHDLAKPRGKQDWQLHPHSIWYPRTSGIWQSVWLEMVPDVYIDHLRWTPHFDRWEIGFEAYIKGTKETFCLSNLNLKLKLEFEGEVLVNDTYQVLHGEVHRRIALSDPGIDDYRNELLWSPERPNLIDAVIELWDGSQLLDKVESYTALRNVTVERGRFLLNSRPYYLRLVLDQGYWPETLMTPPSEEAIREDIRLVKAMGFNGVRKHQKIEDPRFLYWADVMGLLVWEEMPSAYRFTEKAVARIVKEWMEVIERDSSHPCIIMWVPFNESWGVPNLTETTAHQNFVQTLYYLTKSLDPSRPVLGNDGWESTDTDIIGIHDYDANPARIENRYEMKLSDLMDRKRPGGRVLTLDGHPHRGQPVILSEFGGIACTGDAKAEEDKFWGYSEVRNSAEFLEKYSELLSAVHNVEIFSGFCYTQLTDTFQEANGLLYADRRPKADLKLIAKATLGEVREHSLPCGPMDHEGQNHTPQKKQAMLSPYEKGNVFI